MILGNQFLSTLTYTINGGWWEAAYLTPLIDDSVIPNKVVQLIPESRNFAAVQKDEFLAQLNSVAGAQMLAANDARLVAEANLATEQTAHAATSALLATSEANLTAEQTSHAATKDALAAEQSAHAATTDQLNVALTKLAAAGIP